MADHLTPEREQEIRETHPGSWYDGPWTQDYVEADGDEPAYNKVVHRESDTVLATLPDFAGPIALFIADAHDAIPELLREIDSLRKELGQASNDRDGACLARWEEEQDNQRLRLALKSAQRGRRDLRAGRDALAEVRRLCKMTIACSVRSQAIDQAHDTLAVIDQAMGRQTPNLASEQHEDQPTA